MSYDPKIVVFACNWCAYAGADLAGVNRMQYPSNIRIIRTMCSGRLDPGFVLRAFEKGSDGVLILGCHPGDCQYVEGNLKTEKRVQMISRLLEAIGFDNERLKLKWVSASEATRFADIVKGFVDDLKSKGPHMIKKEA
jgi:coenzyme F420-reducing hydrogenase delta subunit|tara:strand:+ start:1446 stop:1859 length:414 start_codon:yes stop_codon:yes gene_type:complete